MRVPISARSLICSAKSQRTRRLVRHLDGRRDTARRLPINFNMGTLVGSYASVAAMLDEAAAMPGVKGIMLTFDDFLVGMDAYGTRIQPLMHCRKHISTPRPGNEMRRSRVGRCNW